MHRIVRGLGALLVLAMVLAGVPWLLITMAGNPLPSRLDPSALWRALRTPDDGTILVHVIAIIAWIAWLAFALSVITELIAVLSRRRVRIRLPGLAGPQKIAGALVLLVMAMFVAPQQFAVAEPAPQSPATSSSASSARSDPASSATSAPHRVDTPADDSSRSGAAGADRTTSDSGRSDTRRTDEDVLMHTVQPGDDLWTLAEHYYGSGQDWRRIARANPSVLTGGPDRLEPGWRLRIPDVDPATRRIVVRSGESLSSIADREYGNAADWPRIYAANRGVLSDPDVVPVGAHLIIPEAAERRQPAATVPDAGPVPGEDASGSAPSTGADSEPGKAAPTQTAPTQAAPSGVQPTQAAPSEVQPTEAAPTQAAPTGSARSDNPAAGTPVGGSVDETSDGVSSHALEIAGIGGLLAAAVIGGLGMRRQLQLRARPVGRRIPHPPPAAQQLETRLGRRQAPQGLELLDLALRAIGQDCLRRGYRLPTLQAARVLNGDLVLLMSEPDQQAPAGFRVDGGHWRLDPAAVDFLAPGSTAADAAQPYPGLTSVGTDRDGATVLVNLEAAGLLAVAGTAQRTAAGVLVAMATELSFCPWADELVLTLVGDDHGLAESIDRYNVSTIASLDQLLDRWEQRARVQRDHLRAAAGAAGDYRINADLADPWVPELGLVLQEPDQWQAERLERLLLSDPPVTMAAVVIGDRLMTDWRLTAEAAGSDPGGSASDVELAPLGWRIVPQRITDPVGELMNDLIGCTGSEQTEPAPWWVADFPPGSHAPTRALAGPPSDEQADVLSAERWSAGTTAADDPAASPLVAGAVAGMSSDDHGTTDGPGAVPPTEVRVLPASDSWPSAAVRATGDPVEELVARSDADWAWMAAVDRPRASKESAIVPNPFAARTPQAPRYPTIMLLGPAQLLGAAGEPPNRAVMQCIEYCTWLLEHPGSTAQAMAAGLAVAEGTRRSNMSRLRNWLGSDDRGEPYLPDAYSGRITLSPLVSSDWHRLQILTATGVNRTGTEGLCKALDLVRGAPLADAAPGQWHWAEEIRTDMLSVIRDIGVELTDRALAESDIDLARWAASRALTATPQDEFLLGARIRTEHQAGNSAEVERLALQLAAQGRALGVDLHPDTVDLLQQVVEGRLRARA